MPTSQQFKTRDIFLSSAIFAITRKAPNLEVDRDLSVFVHASSDEVNAIIAKYNGNESVPIQDFIAAYKVLRAKMYAARR